MEHPLATSKEHFMQKAEEEWEARRQNHPAIKCISKTRDGRDCLAYAVNGTTLCEAHGGLIERNKAPKSEIEAFEPKKRTKFKLTGRMDEIREIVKQDSANILDSTEEIEVLTSRFQFLLEVSEGLPLLTSDFFTEFDKWQEIKKSGNKLRFAEQTARMEKAAEACRNGAAASKEMYVLTEQLRRFKETEIKRRISMRQMMDAHDVTKLIDAVKVCVDAGLSKVPNKDDQIAFKKEFSAHFKKIFMMPSEPTRSETRTGGNNPHV